MQKKWMFLDTAVEKIQSQADLRDILAAIQKANIELSVYTGNLTNHFYLWPAYAFVKQFASELHSCDISAGRKSASICIPVINCTVFTVYGEIHIENEPLDVIKSNAIEDLKSNELKTEPGSNIYLQRLRVSGDFVLALPQMMSSLICQSIAKKERNKPILARAYLPSDAAATVKTGEEEIAVQALFADKSTHPADPEYQMPSEDMACPFLPKEKLGFFYTVSEFFNDENTGITSVQFARLKERLNVEESIPEAAASKTDLPEEAVKSRMAHDDEYANDGEYDEESSLFTPPVLKSTTHQENVLMILQLLGYSEDEFGQIVLPRRPKGKIWVKSIALKVALIGVNTTSRPYFLNKSAFDKAWQELRDDEVVIEDSQTPFVMTEKLLKINDFFDKRFSDIQEILKKNNTEKRDLYAQLLPLLEVK